jgi:hypothetical protein
MICLIETVKNRENEMRPFIMAFLLCSASPASLAQVPSELAPAAQQMEEIRVSTARIALPELRRNMWPDEFDEIKGEYRLSNGKSMRLISWGNRMYAAIEGLPRTQLVAVAPYDFVALDQTMKLSVDNGAPSGTTAVILLSNRRLAGLSSPDFTRLTASR